MKIGAYFAYWSQEWDVNYLKYIEKAKRAGCDVIEVSSAIMNLSDDQLKQLGRTADKAGIALTACLGISKDMDVSSTDETVRHNGVQFMKKLFEAMDKANIRKIGGIIYAYWPCDYNLPFNKDIARLQSIKSIREMADYAGPFGIELGVEVVNRFEHFLINDAKEAVQYVKDVGRSNVKILLDTFHMNIEEDNIGDAIRYTAGLLGHFHIGECNRKVPGKGHMPWDEIGQALRDINYKGYVVMEPFVKMGGRVGKDIKVWRDLSDDADEIRMDKDIHDAVRFIHSKFD